MTLLISHIPKTAGTSLKLLVEKLNPDTTWVYKGELALGNPNLEFAGNFRNQIKNTPPPPVVMGHFSYGAHRLLGIKPAYVTVLRNPVARVVSLYRYQKQLPDSPFLAHFRNNISLKDFVTGEITEMTNNHACRVIAGIPPEAGMTINQRWLLDLALHNLHRHYVLTGTIDHMPAFLQGLGALLHWPAMDLPKANVTEGPDVTPDSATIDCILERNHLDIELYQYVLGKITLTQQ